MRLYRGERRPGGLCFVEVLVTKPDGTVTSRHPLDPQLDLVNHSPTGFEWGYLGSGCAQLGMAILADCLGGAEAKQHYQAFKADVICGLSHEAWELTETEIGVWHGGQHEAAACNEGAKP